MADDAQPLLEPRGRGFLEPRCHVAIYVQRYSYPRVPETFVDNLRVDSLPEHQSSMGVSGVMKSVAFHSCMMHDLLESPGETPREDRGSHNDHNRIHP